MRIAVVGAGIAGITAAHLLSREHEVHVFEQNGYIGGHTNTRIVTDGPDEGTAIDTGFIVCNSKNYPNFYRLLSRLGVELQDSEMSFGYHDIQREFRYSGPLLRYSLRRPENFLQGDFWRLLREQRRFNALMRAASQDVHLNENPLGPFLRSLGISALFIKDYVAPLVASIWSSPESDVETFPARTFIVFFQNHSMFELSRIPRWQTVVGGSHAYVRAFEQSFGGHLYRSEMVRSVRREHDKVHITAASGKHVFDKVVIAIHADQALALLADPSEAERRLLGNWRYNKNLTILHTDSSVLGGRRRDWASWNYVRDGRAAGAPISITYYMNRLQRLKTAFDYFVTLNPPRPIDSSKIIFETWYEHPVYNTQVIREQRDIGELLGQRHTYYCGAYLGYGFHEDGVNSALAVCGKFGVRL